MPLGKSFQSKVASIGGAIWIPKGIRSVFPPWPFSPPVLYGLHKTESNGLDYHCFKRYLKPGDFLVSYNKEFKLSNQNISATVFKHLAVYTGPIHGIYDQPTQKFSKVSSIPQNEYKDNIGNKGYFSSTVTHAISQGVVVEDFFDFLKHYDKVAAIRPTEDPIKQKIIVDSALENAGLGYNFDFQPDGPKSFYCTELGEYCLKQADLPLPERYKINTSWKGFLPWNWFRDKYKLPVILADDVCSMFPMVCTTVSCDDSEFWSESRYSDKLRKAIQDCPDARVMY